MKYRLFCTTLILLFCNMVFAQKTIPLYDEIPGSKSDPAYHEEATGEGEGYHVAKVTTPTLEIYKAADGGSHAPAIIIFPGGGYAILAYNHEGRLFAERLQKWGVTAIVVKYRLPDDAIMEDKSIGPLQDAERAIQYVRENAKELGINPNKIGIMGFSAGGHLASTLATKYNEVYIPNPKKTSLRPDFVILGYPVISFESDVTHMGSRDRLIGKNPSRKAIHRFSSDHWVDEQTSPTFLVLAADDKAVIPENSIRYFDALVRSQVPVEMHIFDKGGHGFGLHNGYGTDGWLDLLKGWMEKNHFLEP